MRTIPNVYEAYYLQNSQSKNFDKKAAVEKLFPSTRKQNITQIAYYFKKLTLLKESNAEKKRDGEFSEIVKNVNFFVSKNKDVYKYALSNTFGIPVVGFTSNLKQIHDVVRQKVNPNLKVESLITASSIPFNQVIRFPVKYPDGFDTILYVYKHNKSNFKMKKKK